MRFRIFLAAISQLLTLTISAQSKTFAFSHIQSRNNVQEWSKSENVGERTASFSSTEIKLNVDRNYNLDIISKTDLPNRGFIYLCKDEKSNAVTVVLFDNLKMYLYNQTQRFLINFNPVLSRKYMADAD